MELVHPENTAGGSAVAAGFGTEAGRVGGVAQRQFCAVKHIVCVIADQSLLTGTDQREIFTGEIIGLICEKRQITGTEQGAFFGGAGGHEHGEAAFDQEFLDPEEKRLRQHCSLTFPVIETGLGNFGTPGNIKDIQLFAEFLMVFDREIKGRDGSDFFDFDVAGIIGAVGHIIGEQVGHADQHLPDAFLQGVEFILFFAELKFDLFDPVAGLGVGGALFAQAVAFAAEIFNLHAQCAAVGVEFDQTVDIDGITAALAVFLNHFRIFADEFNIDHFSVPCKRWVVQLKLGHGERRHEFGDLLTDGAESSFISADGNGTVDEFSDFDHFRFFEAAGGDRRGADTDTAGDEGFFRIEGDHVLVSGDVGDIQRVGNLFTGSVFGTQVDQCKVVVGTAGNDTESAILQFGSKLGSVEFDLVLIGFEFRFECFTEADRFGGDHMFERSALQTGEDGGVPFTSVRN